MLLSLPLGRLVLYLLPAPVSSAMLSVVTRATSVLSSGAKYASFGSRKRDWLGRNGETGVLAAEEGEEQHAERHQHVVRFRVLPDSTMKPRGNANSVLAAWSSKRAVRTENTDLALLFYPLPRFHDRTSLREGWIQSYISYPSLCSFKTTWKSPSVALGTSLPSGMSRHLP